MGIFIVWLLGFEGARVGELEKKNFTFFLSGRED
jgi:hypothetical protein